jgi:hypothetical protein
VQPVARPSSGYSLQNGTKVPGASTIAKIIDDGGGLLYWANTQGLGEPLTLDQFLRCPTLKKQNLPQREFAESILSDLSHRFGPLRVGGRTLQEAREKVMDAGTCIHNCIEAWLHNDRQPAIPTQHEKSVANGFEAFREWYEQTKLKPLESEQARVSRRYAYGGTPDLVAEDPSGRIYVADWKTGRGTRVYPSQLLQVRAYGQLVREVDGIPVDRYAIIKFDRDTGDFAHTVKKAESLDVCWQAFLHCLDLYKMRKKIQAMC